MPTAAYDAIAEWYDRSIRQRALLSADDVVTSALFALLGDLHNVAVCDLACGQGQIARQLARRGARVVGVDISRKLLDIAEAEESADPRGITYLHEDAQTLATLTDTTFYGIVCNMALMDIPDLAATFRAVHRVLHPGGWFAFSITHPCFQSPPNRPYHDEGFWLSDNPSGVRGQVGAHHRTLATYLNTLAETGLTIERLAEPQISGRETPAILIGISRKADTPIP